MNFEKFKNDRELFLSSNLTRKGNERVYEFFENKYSNEILEEGVVSSVVGWLKKKLSPKAYKIKKLGKEYYDWLMSEYDATYRTKKDVKSEDLDKFLRRELISADIKDKIAEIAGDDKDYQDLAKKLILANTLKAKKNFSASLLGASSPLAQQYTEEFDKAFKDSQRFETKFEKGSDANAKALIEDVNIKKNYVIETAIEMLISSYQKAEEINGKLAFAKDSELEQAYKNANMNLTKPPDPMVKKRLITVFGENKIDSKNLSLAKESLFNDFSKAVSDDDLWGTEISKFKPDHVFIFSRTIFIINLFNDKVKGCVHDADILHDLTKHEIFTMFEKSFEYYIPK